MRTPLIIAVSTVALLSGAAMAQTGTNAPTGAQTRPQAATTQATPAEKPATPAVDALSHGSKVRVERMLGKTVVGSDGKEIGSVEDVLIDADSGAASQIVVSSGGVLGLGAKKIAVDYADVSFDDENEQVRVSTLTADAVEGMPEFDYTDSMTSLNRPAQPQAGAAPAEQPPAKPQAQ